MTASGVFQAIEDACAALTLRDRWGDLLTPQEAVSVVATHTDPIWDEVQKGLISGEIDLETYLAACLQLIAEFALQRHRIRVDKNLGDLMQSQRKPA